MEPTPKAMSYDGKVVIASSTPTTNNHSSYSSSSSSSSSSNYSHSHSNSNSNGSYMPSKYNSKAKPPTSSASSSSGISGTSSSSSSSSSTKITSPNQIEGFTAHHYRSTKTSPPKSRFNHRYSQQYATSPLPSSSSSSSHSSHSQNKGPTSISNTSISSNGSGGGSSGSGSGSGNQSPTSSSKDGNNKSKMKRLSLTVSVSTQKYLEKIGRQSSIGADTDDIKELKVLLRNIKQDIRNMKTKGKQHIFSIEKDMARIQFSEVMKIMSDNSLHKTDVGKALNELGEQISTFEENTKEDYVNGLNGLLEPLMVFYESELRKTRELKRKQNIIRIRYEQASQNLHEIRKKHDPTSSKTKQAKKEEDDIKAQYNQTTLEFIESMKTTKKKLQGNLGTMIKEYAEMQIDFYREAMESWEEFQEDLESIIPDRDDDEIVDDADDEDKNDESSEEESSDSSD
ncbi:hypothetical protein DFA_09408 [Cavenderia fasciculata]|uniref:BAR domain-containing protein n=1 Tax=Cavenderia fasciculata TaxID=261658 RepID=F4Q7J5_CACFS|nr:uncharacterized protein DFA_09408 [Cavenderia fasciculata]EGG16377.1 hypothetical protein DFA_09408 [Cavenderia fasciculata]|eukprot:XP_004354761.1 hypothetical protein DFA_09408 [Cavenderia fasciculata]